MPLLRKVLLVLGLGAFLVTDIHGVLTREAPFRPDPELLRRVSPDSPPSVRHEGRHGPYYCDEHSAGGKAPRSLAFITDQVDPKIAGYSDEVSLLVGLDSSGTVTGVRLLDHKETTSYMKTVVDAGFLEKLAGRKLGADLAGVDAVTGATITSNAMREDILQGGALLCEERFGLEIEAVSPPPGFLDSLRGTKSLALLAAMGLALAAFGARSFRAGRAVSLGAGFLVLGLYLNLPLSTAHFTGVASMRFPSPANAPLILLLAFVLVTGVLFRSRIYCDYMCPFAAVQEAIHAASKRKSDVSDNLWRGATNLRHLLLFAIVLLVAAGGYHAAGAMEPYVFLFNPRSDPFPWIYVATVMVAAFFIRRFWCRVFCPCGVCVELVASVRGRRGPSSRGLKAARNRGREDQE